MTRFPVRQLTYRLTSDLIPNPHNPRKHTRAQIEALANSIAAFGFNAPILVDRIGNIMAGHGRLEAAKSIGLTEVPVVCLENLSEAQARAYMIADNRLTDRSSWNEEVLAVHLKELSDLALEFNIEATGFELPEIDVRIESLNTPIEADGDDDFDVADRPAVSCAGDVWHLGEHRLLCGSALEAASYVTLMAGERATATITDPPYNVKISGHVSGLGAAKHREFKMASGEMAEAEFSHFLTTSLGLAGANTLPGGIIDAFMDWRHMGEMLAAGRANRFDLLNLCVWVKTNAGMGSLYRSKHELVFVFRNGNTPHRNNIQLGRFGRYRTNVWTYAGANIRHREGREELLALHPTVKPIMLIADAIRDSTVRGDIVLDPFLGSGTTILAAERTNRRGYGIELDPLYVDTAIVRWQRMTGRHAINAGSGRTYTEIAAEREVSHG
jgi:DNA modification methylase